MKEIRIATWNLCLGMFQKRDYIRDLLFRKKIDVLNMQEVELNPDTDPKYLSIKGFKLELGVNEDKIRVGTYVSNKIKYKRRMDLETKNSNIVIIDLLQNNKLRIVNLYRPFNPKYLGEKDFFNMQVKACKRITDMT